MIRGWKNNPEWVRLHDEKQKDRMERKAQILMIQNRIDMELNRFELQKKHWRCPSLDFGKIE